MCIVIVVVAERPVRISGYSSGFGTVSVYRCAVHRDPQV